MCSGKNDGLKNAIMQQLEDNCNKGTKHQEQVKRSEFLLCRLLYIALILICTQLHVNGNKGGILFSLAMEMAHQSIVFFGTRAKPEY